MSDPIPDYADFVKQLNDPRRVKEWLICTDPKRPIETRIKAVEAINVLDAFDQYAISNGNAAYTSVDDYGEYLGTDPEHGLWAVSGNMTVYAIETSGIAVNLWKQIQADGVTVTLTRIPTGQLTVVIDTSSVDPRDEDPDGAPIIQVLMNQGEIYSNEGGQDDDD